MDTVDSVEATADELIEVARRRGWDFAAICAESMFVNANRWIYLWRENDDVRYNMQGRIDTLPGEFKDSASAFTGWWNEAGTLENIDDAADFVHAWIVESREVDHSRYRRDSGSGVALASADYHGHPMRHNNRMHRSGNRVSRSLRSIHVNSPPGDPWRYPTESCANLSLK